MAKIAKCGYGSDGRGLGATTDGYTYIVNDNVKTGDIIQVVSTSRAGKKFATTAVPLHAYKENSVMGQKAKSDAMSQTGGQDPTRAYSGKELGLGGKKGEKTEQQGVKGLKPQSEYTMRARAGNIAKYMETNPNAELTEHAQETFETYSKPFMKGGQ